MVTIEIVPNDTKMVAKAIILDSKNNVLFLKRSDYVEKFSGEWDLPGGQLKEGETLLDGLVREVKEETGFCVKKPITFFKRLDKNSELSREAVPTSMGLPLVLNSFISSITALYFSF